MIWDIFENIKKIIGILLITLGFLLLIILFTRSKYYVAKGGFGDDSELPFIVENVSGYDVIYSDGNILSKNDLQFMNLDTTKFSKLKYDSNYYYVMSVSGATCNHKAGLFSEIGNTLYIIDYFEANDVNAESGEECIVVVPLKDKVKKYRGLIFVAGLHEASSILSLNIEDYIPSFVTISGEKDDIKYIEPSLD